LLGQPVVRGEAVDRQVAARLRRRSQRQLHLVHGGQQRNAPLLVHVDAHAEVDLVRPRVRQIGFGEAQDRIARGHFNGGKEGHDRYSMGGEGTRRGRRWTAFSGMAARRTGERRETPPTIARAGRPPQRRAGRNRRPRQRAEPPRDPWRLPLARRHQRAKMGGTSHVWPFPCRSRITPKSPTCLPSSSWNIAISTWRSTNWPTPSAATNCS